MGTDTNLGDAGERLRMRSHERRIEGQHARLDEFAHDVYDTLQKSALDKEGIAAALEDFRLYETALEAHMSLEEDVTFPRLHGLRPDLGERLTTLIREHDRLREEVEGIKAQLGKGDRSGARFALEAFARRLDRHEASEEELMARVGEGPMVAVDPTS
ncbi:MAG: hemerythrin domain-containing protein [bacterium]|nr:hemerythrin domain-containing protein [bacterium]